MRSSSCSDGCLNVGCRITPYARMWTSATCSKLSINNFERASDRSASKLALRAELLRRVRIERCQLDLCFLNHLPPQGIRIRIENRSGIPLKNEPRAQFYFLP